MNEFLTTAAFPLTLAALAAALILLACQWRAVRGITLEGPWWWSGGVLLFLAGVETLVGTQAAYGTPAVAEPLRFVALTGLFLPLISLLGAKRPQHKAWHFIVLSLWFVLALPAAETLFLQRGQALEVYDARCWFLLALIIVTALNLGIIRWWPAALLIAAAQSIMLATYLPGLRTSQLSQVPPDQRIAFGCCLILLALIVWLVQRRYPRSVPRWDRLWLAFRDGFGALWSIRVAEQINQVAQQQQWTFRLQWGGFRSVEGQHPLKESPFEQQPALAQVIENQLRRFVNKSWIEARLGESLDALKRPSK